MKENQAQIYLPVPTNKISLAKNSNRFRKSAMTKTFTSLMKNKVATNKKQFHLIKMWNSKMFSKAGFKIIKSIMTQVKVQKSSKLSIKMGSVIIAIT